jgi:hypothetical protein
MLDYEHAGRALSPEEQANATLALTQSDNAAIEALFGDLEEVDGGLAPASAAVQQLLRSAGDETTIINTAPNSEGLRPTVSLNGRRLARCSSTGRWLTAACSTPATPITFSV